MPKVFKRLSFTQILLALALLAAVFLRLYNLKGTLHFQGDQGRDAMIVAQIFKEKDPVFIGPVTSVGNMYLGPLYYYFMLPWLWLSYPSPIGPAYAVAALGIITVWLMYKLGKELIGDRAALIATIFFAFTSTVITYTRFSWNPNPAPLIAAIMVYLTYKAWQKNPWWWIGVTACFAVLLQLHYLTLLSAGGAGIIWLISLGQNLQQKGKQLKLQLKASLISAISLILSFTPLVLFDSKHNWLNANAFYKLLFSDRNFKTTAGGGLMDKITKTLLETHGRGMHALFEIAIGQHRVLNTFLLIIVVLILIWLLVKRQKNKFWAGWIVISAYLFTGILGTSIYEHTIFDHYISYLFPISFWVYGICFNFLIEKSNLLGKFITAGCIAGFIWFNMNNLPLSDISWTIDDMKNVADQIYQEIEPEEKYNLVLFSESHDLDAQNYRYFLSTTDRPPLKKNNFAEAETLIIINEDGSLQDVGSSPVYEIVIFPDKEPKKVLNIPGGPEIIILSTRESK